jgi:transposase
LCSQEVKSVALEATGIYWLCLYSVLESAGIKVLVVNGRHVRNLPGRKTDMSDCQWLATLHSHGLLRSGFVPAAEIRRVQDYVRLRQDHVAQAAGHVQHMQKALERMNLKPHDVIRSLVGVSGQNMIRAIVAGERDPQRLVQMCEAQIRVKKSKRLEEALTGTWKDEHLFALRQALNAWDFCQGQIVECDRAIEEELQKLGGERPDSTVATTDADSTQAPAARNSKAHTKGVQPGSKRAGTGKRNANRGTNIVGLSDLLVRICDGKDATTIPGISEVTLLQLLAEVGTDMTQWPTAKHFVAWLGLAPGSHQSGKRAASRKRTTNRAGRLFCMAAVSLSRSVDKAFGGFYRRLRARRGARVANKALARKMATMFWQLMVYGVEYVEEGLKWYETKAAATQLQQLRRLARQNGMMLVPNKADPGRVIG